MFFPATLHALCIIFPSFQLSWSNDLGIHLYSAMPTAELAYNISTTVAIDISIRRWWLRGYSRCRQKSADRTGSSHRHLGRYFDRLDRGRSDAVYLRWSSLFSCDIVAADTASGERRCRLTRGSETSNGKSERFVHLGTHGRLSQKIHAGKYRFIVTPQYSGKCFRDSTTIWGKLASDVETLTRLSNNR